MNIEKVMKQLKKNGMDVYDLKQREQVVAQVRELIPEGSLVSVGGSVTLQQTGVMDLLRSGSYRFLDRDRKGITREEVQQVYRETFSADAYLCSAGAITEEGELVNVDGNSNRIAALAFGPQSVLLVEEELGY